MCNVWSRNLAPVKKIDFVSVRFTKIIRTGPCFETPNLSHLKIASAFEVWEESYNHKPALKDSLIPTVTWGKLGHTSITPSGQFCNSQPFPNTWKRGLRTATPSSCAVCSKWVWKEQCIFYCPGQTPWHLRRVSLCKIIRGWINTTMVLWYPQQL